MAPAQNCIIAPAIKPCRANLPGACAPIRQTLVTMTIGQRKIRNGPKPMSEHNPIPKPNNDKENISFQFMEVSQLYFANIPIGPSGLIVSFNTEYGTSMYCGPAAYAATW